MPTTPPKNEINDEKWDFKKILIALVIIVPLLILAFSYKDLLLATVVTPKVEKKSVPVSKIPSSSDIQLQAQEKIESIKAQIEGLSVSEIATSSPQVKKIIDDIKALPEYPGGQAKSLCLKICEGI